jgi:uncharacterized protein
VAIAAARCNATAVRILPQHGADPFKLDSSVRNTLNNAVLNAAAKGRTQILELLLHRDTAKLHSSAPLVAAATYGQLERVEWLLARGVKIDAVDRLGWTALHATWQLAVPTAVSA